MKVYYPDDLFDILKNKHLLLDTNVFIDSFNFDQPQEYINLFNTLKENDTTLTTIDGVVYEFLKGSKSKEAFNTKKEFIEQIIDVELPKLINTEYVEEIIQKAGKDGGSIEIIDLYLGAIILKYKANLCLLTRNYKDFPLTIYKLISTITFPSERTLFTYGVYTFKDQAIQ